jgi:hypothetical protein
MSAIAARVNNALWDTLVIEVENLLAEMKVFEQSWTTGAGTKSVLVVGDGNSLLRRERGDVVAADLMEFPAVTRLSRLTFWDFGAGSRVLLRRGGFAPARRSFRFLGHGEFSVERVEPVAEPGSVSTRDLLTSSGYWITRDSMR